MSAKKKILVLANSFSGQDLVDLLLDNPSYQGLGVSRSPERPPVLLRYRQRRDLSAFRYYQLDLNVDNARILELLDAERPAYVVNFAAQSEVGPSWEHPEQWFETNTVALAKLVNHLRRCPYLERYLHVSSPEAYGNCVGRVTEDSPLAPSTPYAASKAAADLLLATYQKEFAFPLLTVRASNVYGARQQLFKIIPRSIIYLRLGKRIPLHGGGRAVKSFIHIRDVSRGELAILEKGAIGRIYNLSPDQGISVRDLVRALCERMGKSLAESAEIVAERPGQDAAYVIDSSRARLTLGWAPTIALEQGLAEVIDWVDGNWEQIAAMPLVYQHKA